MDQPKIERVLRLMRLMSGNSYFTVDELARKLDTSYRSIYRYIDTFKESGFAVEKIHGNVYRIIRMPSQFKDLANLVYFSQEEARIVGNLIEGLDETNALKIELRRKLAAIYDRTNISEYVVNTRNSANVQALGNAIRDGRKVILKNYESSSSGSIRDRIVEPFGFTTGYVNVWAYDLSDGLNKLFRVSRMDWVDVLSEGWEHGQDHRMGYLDVFRIQSFTRTHVRLEMTLRAKNLLCEEYPLASFEVRQDGDRWVLDTMVSGLEGVGRFVIGLAADVTTVDSPELDAYIRRYVRANFPGCM